MYPEGSLSVGIPGILHSEEKPNLRQEGSAKRRKFTMGKRIKVALEIEIRMGNDGSFYEGGGAISP